LPEHILLIGADLLKDVLSCVSRKMPVMHPFDSRFQAKRDQQADGDGQQRIMNSLTEWIGP